MKPTNKSTVRTPDTFPEKAIILPEIRIRKYDNDKSNTVAFVDLNFNGFVVTGITVVYSPKKDECFVAMPQKLGKEKKYFDTCYPITKEYRDALYSAILEEFNHAE